MTQWKPLPDPRFARHYEVSDQGEVRRLAGVDCAGRRRKARTRALSLRAGYPMLMVSAEGERDILNVHRLVAEAFCPPPDTTCIWVNHKNGVKTDNRADNLEWVTPSGNHRHAIRTGLRKTGEALGSARFTDAQAYEIAAEYMAGGQWRVMARKYHVCRDALRGAVARVAYWEGFRDRPGLR